MLLIRASDEIAPLEHHSSHKSIKVLDSLQPVLVHDSTKYVSSLPVVVAPKANLLVNRMDGFLARTSGVTGPDMFWL